MEKQSVRKSAAEAKEIIATIRNILKEKPKSSQVAIKKELKKILNKEVSQPTIHRYLTVELGMVKDKELGWVAVQKDAKQTYQERLSELLETGHVREAIYPVQLAVLKVEEGYAGLFEAQINGGYEEALAGTLVLNGGLLLAVKDNEAGGELLSVLGLKQAEQEQS